MKNRTCFRQTEARWPSLLTDWPEKKNDFGIGRWVLASCQFSSKFMCSAIAKEKSKMVQPTRQSIRFKDDYLLTDRTEPPSQPPDLVKYAELFLPVEFRQNLFIGYICEVENSSANQMPRRPSLLTDWSEKHKLGRGRRVFTSCQVSSKFMSSAAAEDKSKMSQPTRGRLSVDGSYRTPTPTWSKKPSIFFWSISVKILSAVTWE